MGKNLIVRKVGKGKTSECRTYEELEWRWEKCAKYVSDRGIYIKQRV